MKAHVAGYENPRLTEAVDIQLSSTVFLGRPMLGLVKQDDENISWVC